MVRAKCPITGCEYQSEDLEAAIAASQLTVHGHVHAGSNLKKPERPEVTHDMSESEWREFTFNFKAYKKDARIEAKPEVIRSELQNCCRKSVRTRIFQMKGSALETISENDLMEANERSTMLHTQVHSFKLFDCNISFTAFFEFFLDFFRIF